MTQTEGTLDYNGVKICYTKAGEGPPLILIHGWSFNYRGWQPQIDFFSKSYTVIAYDWFGMGCSGGGERPYRFQAVVDLLGFVIERLCDGQKPIVVGHSVGSTTTLAYAVQASDRMAAAVCSDGSLPQLRTDLFALVFTAWARLLGLFSVAAFVKLVFFSTKWRDANPDALAAWRRQFASNLLRPLINGTWMWTLRPNPRRQLGRITVPMLIINGSKDVSCSPGAAARLHRLIAGSQFEIIEGAGHMVYVEQPDTFTAIVDRWLQSLGGRS
jgi:3-oxoadipate enol-lactonase